MLSHVQLFVTSQIRGPCQAPLSILSKNTENGSPFPSPGNLCHPRTEPTSPALQVDSWASWGGFFLLFFFFFKSCPGKKKNPHHRANLQHLLVSSTIACSTLKSMTMPWGPWLRSSPLPTPHPHQSCWKARLSYATWMFAFEESSLSEWNPFCYFQKGKSLETTQQR